MKCGVFKRKEGEEEFLQRKKKKIKNKIKKNKIKNKIKPLPLIFSLSIDHLFPFHPHHVLIFQRTFEKILWFESK